jgi:SWI/SNF-related matrix-associated actin-dependent regulator of chromatin subfamily A3
MTDLLPHQSQALAWMIAHENPKLPKKEGDAAVQFWALQNDKKKAGKYWLNVATKTPQAETPVLGRGGIIADGMGLGKTLAMLALVFATKEDKVGEEYSGATLIGKLNGGCRLKLTPVCPLSVLSNWEKQIRDHVVAGKLSSCTYHGAGKAVTPTTLSQYDVS